jgi:hypothetical protein
MGYAAVALLHDCRRQAAAGTLPACFALMIIENPTGSICLRLPVQLLTYPGCAVCLVKDASVCATLR